MDGVRKITAAFFTVYDHWLNDRMFDGKAGGDNDVFERYAALQKYLLQRNIHLHTYDLYDAANRVDVWLMMEPSRTLFLFLLKHRINPRRVVLFLQEPPTVNPKAWRYLNLYRWPFKMIATWNTALCAKSKQFFHYSFHPVSFAPKRRSSYLAQKKTNLAVLMHSNKHPTHAGKGELLSFRRSVIHYFDQRGDGLLDLYGTGWNDARHSSPFFSSSYRGWAEDKREMYAKHFYVFSIANYNAPGYFTYDPFLAMAVGSVPVYYPMPDSFPGIPRDTVVSLFDFQNFDSLTQHLKDLLVTGKYEEMRERGWRFLNSDSYRPFTIEQFCHDIYGAIQKAVV